MVHRSSRDLPRIGFAGMQAEGFANLAVPRLRRRRRAGPRPCAHDTGHDSWHDGSRREVRAA